MELAWPAEVVDVCERPWTSGADGINSGTLGYLA
jgi:hypothetical protein